VFKVKLVPFQPKKVYVGEEVTIHMIDVSIQVHDLSVLYSEKLLRFQLKKRLVGPQSKSGCFGVTQVVQKTNTSFSISNFLPKIF